MEAPFGFPHNHRHHHRRSNSETDEPLEMPAPPQPPFDQPPPPPYYQSNEFAPPPPYYQDNEFAPPPPRPPPPYYQQTEEYAPPPPHPPPYVYQQQEFNPVSYQPPAAATGVSHVAHEVHQDSETSHHSFRPHLPSFTHSHSHSASSSFSNKPTVKVYCKAEPNFALTIRDDKVILAPYNPSDEFQHWYKDEKYSTRVKDEEGFPCFALVNKATGQAIKHSVGATHPVQLIPYNADVLDESVLWSESKDLGDGYRAVRMINNIRLNVDAFHGDKNHGGVHDGTTIVLWEWAKGDNQRWRITCHCKFFDRRNA